MTISVDEPRMHAVPAPSIAVMASVNGLSTESNKHSLHIPKHTHKRESGPAYGSLYDACVAMRDKVDAFLAEEPATALLRRAQEQARVSVRVVEEALERYRPEELSISYNGGKDCLVMLIVLLACFARRYSAPKPAPGATAPNGPSSSSSSSHLPPFPEKLRAVYIVSTDPFAEVDDFVEASSADYHLDVSRFMLPMKKGLEVFKTQNPSVRAIFVGTRRTDPHGEKLKHFDPTDEGWPDFMRIHPVIDWHYTEIWAFTRHLELPYCPLYDQGYTSLGGRKDTLPNPRLKKEGCDDEFRPAYELVDDDEERLGRFR
ncbi:hypothetical protein TgHK011_005667 [Trichoderma gracile]|nr:hypothetical protein TgHK011_005667 [Trichoderma gracile]